ncbi:MAG TPA: RnfABCDGE type electron transport complex subunit B [Kiritimatiellia bacterium]|nr:RnfABCDGE type electron transport complex subunit B [Kiritimatiellia bacterium]HPS08028.1 RnfABCDGE type electron transport complex subunit B [Kiritimatiellia bacterium]
MDPITTSTLCIGGIGLVSAAALAVAEKYLSVPQDPRIAKVAERLPGANCGGCGFAGCADYARAIVMDNAECNLCAPGGAACANAIASFLGRAAGALEKRSALVLCCGDNTETTRRAAYNGINDCAAAQATAGGDKGCAYGCLGYGACARVCPVNAISVVNGLAKVNKDTCIACGKCVAACPRKIIKLVPAAAEIHVLCSSKDKGPAVKKVCGTGCIGCRICNKLSDGAITMDGFLAVVDYTKPITNEEVITKCPGKCIRKA